ncbi:family 20 glycosylhydrolase [Arthrobacter sp. LAPM80]|uniref:family 20 glycosylhydrolase n=1 Tax=Arthrobacter sp. LAPM80 TaxID=3141788 RepID=UPI00398B57CC
MKIRHRTGRNAVVAALTAAALTLASTAIVLPGANAAVAPALAPAVLAVTAPAGAVPLTPAGAPQTIPGLSTWTAATGQFTLGASAKVIGADGVLTGDLAQQLSLVLDRSVATATIGAIAGDLEVAIDPSRSAALGKEGYELVVGNTVKVVGATDTGAFYGAQTILQLLAQGNTVNKGSSIDVPRYQERGVGLCACQLKISMESLERTMKDMAYNKLNQLWLETKLKSDAYPNANFWSYYTKVEAAQISAWAKKYHIHLVLEVNSPGHMRPWLYKYPELQLVNNAGVKKENQLDISKPEALEMVTKLADEYAAAFPDSTYWHMGGDEYMIGDSYSNYSQFAAFVAANPDKFPAGSGPGDVFIWFMNQVNAYVKSKGKQLRIWNDGVPSSSVIPLDKDIIVEHWVNSGPTPQALLDAGHDVENSMQGLYFNRPGQFNVNLVNLWNTGWTPEKFDGGRTATVVPGKGKILGAKFSAWPDDTPAATEAMVEKQMFATMRFLAQSTWGSPKPTNDFASFTALTNNLGRTPGYNSYARTPLGNGGYAISTASKSVNASGSGVTVSTAANTTWTLASTDDNYYKITAENGQCLAMAGGTLWLEAPMDQNLAPSLSACTTTDPRVNNLQKWEVLKVDGGYMIRNAITQMPLSVNASGALTQQPADILPASVFTVAGEVSTSVTGPARAVAGTPASLTVNVDNRTTSIITGAVVTPSVPAGWGVSPSSITVGDVAAGTAKTASFTLTPAAGASYGNFAVTASTAYTAGDESRTSAATTTGLLSCSAAPVRPVGATVDSFNNGGGEITPGSNAIDGDPNTFWGTAWTPSDAPLPHTITVDLGKEMSICAVNALPRQGTSTGAANGRIKDYELYVSNTAGSVGSKVAQGAFPNLASLQIVALETPAVGRYLTLKALSEQANKPWTTLAELTVDAVDPALIPTAPATTAPATTAPATTAPATTAPATTAPATSAPATTTAPATTAPATTTASAPATTAQATTAPATTTAPAPTAPATTAPATTTAPAPATTTASAPATTAPTETDPETSAPAGTTAATTPAGTTPAATATTTNPAAAVVAKDVRQGQSVTLTGSGFQPGEQVTGTVHSTPVDLGTSVADASGNVSFTWTVPASFDLGQHIVTLTGELSGRSVEASFTVLPSQAVQQDGDGLAHTGANTTSLWGAALLMALVGAGIVLGNRRRAGLHK